MDNKLCGCTDKAVEKIDNTEDLSSYGKKTPASLGGG